MFNLSEWSILRVLVSGILGAFGVLAWHSIRLFRQVQILAPGSTPNPAAVGAGDQWLPWLIVAPPVALFVLWYLSRRQSP